MSFNIPFKTGGGLIGLAPDLTYISDSIFALNTNAYRQTGNLNGTSGFVTAISLTGKFKFLALSIFNNTAEVYTLKLTIDGVIIWNSAKTIPTNSNILGVLANAASTSGISSSDEFQFETSLLLEVQSTTDTSFRFNFIARPIL